MCTLQCSKHFQFFPSVCESRRHVLVQRNLEPAWIDDGSWLTRKVFGRNQSPKVTTKNSLPYFQTTGAVVTILRVNVDTLLCIRTVTTSHSSYQPQFTFVDVTRHLFIVIEEYVAQNVFSQLSRRSLIQFHSLSIIITLYLCQIIIGTFGGKHVIR